MVKDWEKRSAGFAASLNEKGYITTEEEYTEFYEWLLTKEGSGARGLDKIALLKAFRIYKNLQTDSDNFTVIVGVEGTGKSTFGINFCSTVSPSFSTKYICYEPEDFGKALEFADKGDSILMDEGMLFLFTRDALRGSSVNVLKIISIMRQKNVHLCICVPNWFTIDTYIREHRVSVLFNILSRGTYKLITKEGIKKINLDGKRFKNINTKLKSGTFFHGKFYNYFPDQNDLNIDSYRQLKKDNFDKVVRDFNESFKGKTKSDEWVSIAEASRLLGIPDGTMRDYVKEGIYPHAVIGKRKVIARSYIEDKLSESRKVFDL